MPRITVFIGVVLLAVVPSARADEVALPAAAAAGWSSPSAAAGGPRSPATSTVDGRSRPRASASSARTSAVIRTRLPSTSLTAPRPDCGPRATSSGPKTAQASPTPPRTATPSVPSLAAGDFNGDGFSDLAIGSDSEDVPAFLGGTVVDAGAINVLYGSPAGLTANGNQFFSQDTQFIPDGSENGDRFASALAAANFGGSGHDDLAIGVPGEGVGSTSGAGDVYVLLGSITGLSANGAQLWNEDSPGLLTDGVEKDDNFGTSLSPRETWARAPGRTWPSGSPKRTLNLRRRSKTPGPS